MLQETLRHIRENDYGVVERYVHNVRAMDQGDWISSVTASVAILQRIANKVGFDREKCGRELWKQVAGYLKSKAIERPYNYVGWGEEAERLIDAGEPHENLVKAITELRNHVTGHWLKDEVPIKRHMAGTPSHLLRRSCDAGGTGTRRAHVGTGPGHFIILRCQIL